MSNAPRLGLIRRPLGELRTLVYHDGDTNLGSMFSVRRRRKIRSLTRCFNRNRVRFRCCCHRLGETGGGQVLLIHGHDTGTRCTGLINGCNRMVGPHIRRLLRRRIRIQAHAAGLEYAGLCIGISSVPVTRGFRAIDDDRNGIRRGWRRGRGPQGVV